MNALLDPNAEDESEESEEDNEPDLYGFDQVFSAVEGRTTKYILPEDVYSHMFLQVVFKSASRLGAFIFMITVWTMQVALICGVGGRAANTAWTNEVNQFYSLTVASEMSTRISPQNAERICGSYTKVEISVPEHGNVTTAYRYRPFPENKWSANPVLWEPSEMSTLEEAIHGLNLLKPKFGNPPEYRVCIFFGVVMAWGATILLEIKQIKVFLKNILSLETRGLRIRPPEADTNEPLVMESVPRNAMWFALFIVILRSMICLLLYPVGVIFLASSLTLTDLILNAVALAFVLEVDDLAYQGANFFSEGLMRNNLAIQMEDGEEAQFEARWAPTCQCIVITWGSVVGFFVCVCVAVLQYQKIAMWSSVCFFMGPTPNANEAFDVAFPIPGFCESLACANITVYKNKSISCPPAPLASSYWVSTLQKQCRQLLQSNQGTYSSLSQVSEDLGERAADEDFAEADIMDEAANFWCPSKTVLDNYAGSVEGVKTSSQSKFDVFGSTKLIALLRFGHFWKHDWDCQQELKAESADEQWQWWKM